MKTAFETEICSRCSGTGEYSYNAMNGKRCFKCHGNKVCLTKRAEVAVKHWKELRTEVEPTPGKRYMLEVGVQARKVRAGTLVSITPDTLNEGRYIAHFTDVKTGEGFGYGGVYGAGSWVRISTQEELSAAIAHQNSLTKAGKPGKRIAK